MIAKPFSRGCVDLDDGLGVVELFETAFRKLKWDLGQVIGELVNNCKMPKAHSLFF